jgi:hypothetical protein
MVSILEHEAVLFVLRKKISMHEVLHSFLWFGNGLFVGQTWLIFFSEPVNAEVSEELRARVEKLKALFARA